MSALGQKQTYAAQQVMSALPPKADMCSALAHVRWPKADVVRYSITSSAMDMIPGSTSMPSTRAV
jgi:hypothetical protein